MATDTATPWGVTAGTSRHRHPHEGLSVLRYAAHVGAINDLHASIIAYHGAREGMTHDPYAQLDELEMGCGGRFWHPAC